MKSASDLESMRHTLSHVLAAAVKEIYKDAKFGIGPAIDDGFYYDIDFGKTKISDADLEEIEKKIKRLKSVGCPLPGVEVAILDDHGNELGRNEVGSVFVRTNRSMKGYWKRPDASSETIQDGWINTKDMGWIDEDGYLFLSGRSSDMIIRAGENISPAEIEDVLHGHPDVSDVAVISSPSLEWGEEVMAVIVPAEYGSPPAEDELIAYCRRHLASFKCPAIIHFVEELPRTTTGKILKRTLRDQFVQTG